MGNYKSVKRPPNVCLDVENLSDMNKKRTIFKGSYMCQAVAVKKVAKTAEWETFIFELNKRADAVQESIIPTRKSTEFEILRSLHHENIIRLYDFAPDNDCIYMVMELCNKNLDEYCKDDSVNYNINERVYILKQIGKGLAYLHNQEKPIIHGDLKPGHILLKLHNNNMAVKIIDFQKACTENSRQYLNNLKSVYGTPPEVLKLKGTNEVLEVTPAMDIYAYGCMMQTVLTKNYERRYPFGNQDYVGSFLQNAYKGKRQNFLENQEVTDLFILADLAIDDATNRYPKKRPNISTLIRHPLFWSVKHKEMFIIDIKSKYMNENEEFFLTKFNSQFCKRFLDGMYGSEHDVIRYIIKEKKIAGLYPEEDSDKMKVDYQAILSVIRNICMHYGEDRIKFEKHDKLKEILGNNIDTFIDSMLKIYPHFIADLFVSYRNKVKERAIDKLEVLDDGFNKYFPLFATDLREKHFSIDRFLGENGLKFDKDLIHFIKSQDIRPYLKVESVIKYLSQNNSNKIDEVMKNILRENIRLMDKEYYDSITYEMNELDKFNVDAGKSNSCKYSLLEVMLMPKFSGINRIKRLECLDNKCKCKNETFNMKDIGKQYNIWWVSYRENEMDKRYTLERGEQDKIKSIVKNGENIIFYRKKATVEHFNSPDFSESGGRACKFKLPESSKFPKEAIEGLKCEKNCCEGVVLDNDNVNYIKHVSEWSLKYNDKNGLKSISFESMDDEMLTEALKTGKNFKLYRKSCRLNAFPTECTYNFSELMIGTINNDVLENAGELVFSGFKCMNENCPLIDSDITIDLSSNRDDTQINVIDNKYHLIINRENHECDYDLFELLLLKTKFDFSNKEIYGKAYLDNQCPLRYKNKTFSTNDNRIAYDIWWVSYQENEEEKRYILERGKQDKIESIVKNGENIIFHRKKATVKDCDSPGFSVSDNNTCKFELPESSNFPEEALRGLKCEDNCCEGVVLDNENVNYIKDASEWSLKYKNNNGLKSISFESMNNGMLTEALKTGKNFTLYRKSCKLNPVPTDCTYNFPELMIGTKKDDILKKAKEVKFSGFKCMNEDCPYTNTDIAIDLSSNRDVQIIDNKCYRIINGEPHQCEYDLLELLSLVLALKNDLKFKNVIIDGSLCLDTRCPLQRRNDSIDFDILKKEFTRLPEKALWSMRYTENGGKKIFLFANNNADNLRDVLRKGKEFFLQYKNTNESEEHVCEFGLLELLNPESLHSSLGVLFKHCLDGSCPHKSNEEFLRFDRREVQNASTNDYYWWLEYKLESTSRMHSFIFGKWKELINILKNGNDLILHRSSEKFPGECLQPLFADSSQNNDDYIDNKLNNIV